MILPIMCLVLGDGKCPTIIIQIFARRLTYPCHRICPGRFVAENNVFIVICQMLHVYHIGPARNEDGTDVPFVPQWSAGLIT